MILVSSRDAADYGELVDDLVRMRIRPQGRAVGRARHGTPGLSRLTLALGLALLAVEASVAVAIIATSESNEASWWANGLALLAGVAFVVSGLIAITRRPDNRTGVYLAAVGYAWFLGALTDSGNPWVAAVGNILGSLSFAAFAALLLTFPTGRFGSRFERVFPIVVGATFIAITLTSSLVDPTPFSDCPSCPENPLDVVEWSGVSSALDVINDLAGIVLGLTGVVLIVRRWRGAAPAMRRVLWPVLATGGFALGVLVLFGVAYIVTGSEIDRLGPVFLASFAAVPIAFLAGILRTRLARASVSELVVALEAGESLRDALADALDDDRLSRLVLARRASGHRARRLGRSRGARCTGSRSDAERAVKFVEEDGVASRRSSTTPRSTPGPSSSTPSRRRLRWRCEPIACRPSCAPRSQYIAHRHEHGAEPPHHDRERTVGSATVNALRSRSPDTTTRDERRGQLLLGRLHRPERA